MRKTLFVIFLAILLSVSGLSVRAQEAARAEIIKVDASAFPSMSAMLDVYDADGKFASTLDAMNVTVLENGNPISISGLTEQEVGVQLVVAVNPGPSMDTRDSLGVSRYERVVEHLRLWAEARPLEPRDEMSLVTTTGPLLVNATASEWRNSLVSFQPDARTAVPSLQSLSLALDLLEGQQGSQEGMKRSILFLTPHLPDQATVNILEDLTQRALLLGVRVNIWLIDTEAYFPHFSANALKSLALQTGGEYSAYSGIEPIPDPELYFSHLRHVYTFTYESQLSTAGMHNLAVQIQRSDLSLTSGNANFSVDIQPPNPMLLSPPSQIVRQAPEDDPYNAELLLPNEATLEILIEFPDGHPRPITRAALYVDDEMVAELTTPPFEKLQWNISEYLSSGEHSLHIEIEDSLGLTKTSLGVPVTLTVVQPPTGLLAFFGRNGSLLTIGVISLAGLLLGAILLIGGRRSLLSLSARQEAKKASHDPLTQPLPKQETETTKKRSLPIRDWGQRPKRVKAAAYLARLNGKGNSHTGTPIPLTGVDLTFGTDPIKAAFVLDDPSISPLHVTIRQNDEKKFIVKDHNSVAGTWVNFEQISHESATLTHGDIVHIGALRYQFIVEKPPKKMKPKIKVEK
ncbi:MAG: FHA domain-containing protein [Anaerolineae bacterium]|jgi:hypothetical protein|nr:FHA domain-containing protein [Anaerolineae bacterium]MBT7071011.1 FHA domain-containing protein [Anaerolineae bacterium]MBT7325813.1 FHA domain-containing protein [Anaerolineae bacterium]